MIDRGAKKKKSLDLGSSLGQFWSWCCWAGQKPVPPIEPTQQGRGSRGGDCLLQFKFFLVPLNLQPWRLHRNLFFFFGFVLSVVFLMDSCPNCNLQIFLLDSIWQELCIEAEPPDCHWPRKRRVVVMMMIITVRAKIKKAHSFCPSFLNLNCGSFIGWMLNGWMDDGWINTSWMMYIWMDKWLTRWMHKW